MYSNFDLVVDYIEIQHHSHLCVSGTISNSQRWCFKIPKLTILTSFEIIGEAWYSVMISWDGDGEREIDRYRYIYIQCHVCRLISPICSCCFLRRPILPKNKSWASHMWRQFGFSNVTFCLVGFKHSLLFPRLVWDTGKCPFVPKQWLEDHHCPIGMFVGCRNNERSRLWGASTNEPVSVANEMAWNQRHERVMAAIAMSLATANPTHSTRVHHMLKNHLCRSFYKRLAAIQHSRRAAALLPLFLFLLLLFLILLFPNV